MRTLLCALVALLCAVASPSRAADPRIERADALLASADGHPAAIELYRAALADAPDDVETRVRLARALAWSQRLDESVAEYDAALARRPDDAGLRVERAEVLSWDARLDEARAELQSVLAADPTDARARRALARVHRWGGDARRADQAYRDALALEEDGEARAEWDDLRSGYRPLAEGSVRVHRDDADYRRISTGGAFVWWHDLGTRARVQLGSVLVSHDQGAVPLAPEDEDLARELRLELERALDRRWKLRGELGARAWDTAPDRAFGALGVERAGDSGTLGLRLAQTDTLEVTESLEALADGITQTGARMTFWRPLRPGLETSGQVDLNWLSDGNRRQAGGASLSWQPWRTRALRLSLVASANRFSDRTPLYYDPEIDAGAGVAIDHRFAPASWLSFGLGATGGVGVSKDDGERNTGLVTGARGDLVVQRGPWRASAGIETSASQRENGWRGVWAFAALERSF
jgi:tetratricopeptide (TPR) repeat protein